MTNKPAVPPSGGHPLSPLKAFTEARIALGRHGAGLPTKAHLDFAEAHAEARDAVHAVFDHASLETAFAKAGRRCVEVESKAGDRVTYLKRPDLGRRLAERSGLKLERVAESGPFDVALVIADGLSAKAANTYGADVGNRVLDALPNAWRVAPVILARGARVALGDPIGERLGARIVLMLIGERPGLSAADSLGAYLTFGPRAGLSDADRNCVSNIRRGGLDMALAAPKLAALVSRAAALGLSGTRLKDDADDLIAAPNTAAIGVDFS